MEQFPAPAGMLYSEKAIRSGEVRSWVKLLLAS